MYKGVQLEFQTPSHWNLISRSTTAPVACVIAQQYSSATVVSLRFHPRKENCGTLFKTTLFHLKKNCVAVKMHNLNFPKSGSVCVMTSSVSIMLSYWRLQAYIRNINLYEI
jgi:hypothetical protein